MKVRLRAHGRHRKGVPTALSYRTPVERHLIRVAYSGAPPTEAERYQAFLQNMDAIKRSWMAAVPELSIIPATEPPTSIPQL